MILDDTGCARGALETDVNIVPFEDLVQLVPWGKVLV